MSMRENVTKTEMSTFLKSGFGTEGRKVKTHAQSRTKQQKNPNNNNNRTGSVSRQVVY